MTRTEVEKIIEIHRSEIFYSLSCLQIGEVEIIAIGENGFTFKRKTEYIETFGVYEQYDKPRNMRYNSAYTIAEIVIKRFK